MICLKLPELVVWPGAGACKTAELRTSCADRNRIGGRTIRRRAADFVVMMNPLITRSLSGNNTLHSSHQNARRLSCAYRLLRFRIELLHRRNFGRRQARQVSNEVDQAPADLVVCENSADRFTRPRGRRT